MNLNKMIEISFNSKLVRLKVISKVMNDYLYNMFQFQIGSIKSDDALAHE